MAGAVGEAEPPNVYHKIKRSEGERNLYFFKFEDKWLLGETVGEDSAVAYVVEDVDSALDIRNQQWLFHNSEVEESENPDELWVRDWGDVFAADEEHGNVMDALFAIRSIRNFPSMQKEKNGLYNLRNGIAMPAVGLGTGGLTEDVVYNTTQTALQMGYRLLDLAREYGNEATIRSLFEATVEDDITPKKSEVFLLSKVWPTELGFQTTNEAILDSRANLGVTSIDNYMLHWPTCFTEVSWMHCDTTVDREGTWQQSYRSLEKAYAEGDIMSIGVSNFNMEHLEELGELAQVLPHVVQNYASVGEDDADVRNWCTEHKALYQPYAPVRSIDEWNTKAPAVFAAISAIAGRHGKSNHEVVYRYFLQLGTSIIPRSTNIEHLVSNLGALQWSLNPEEMQQLADLNDLARPEEDAGSSNEAVPEEGGSVSADSSSVSDPEA